MCMCLLGTAVLWCFSSNIARLVCNYNCCLQSLTIDSIRHIARSNYEFDKFEHSRARADSYQRLLTSGMGAQTRSLSAYYMTALCLLPHMITKTQITQVIFICLHSIHLTLNPSHSQSISISIHLNLNPSQSNSFSI